MPNGHNTAAHHRGQHTHNKILRPAHYHGTAPSSMKRTPGFIHDSNWADLTPIHRAPDTTGDHSFFRLSFSFLPPSGFGIWTCLVCFCFCFCVFLCFFGGVCVFCAFWVFGFVFLSFIYHVLLYFTFCTFVYILYLYLLLSLQWYSPVISITQGNFNVTHDYTTNEISSTIYCIVSSGTPRETWRWPSDRAETCSL